jgi:hypothetical protein
LGNNVTLEGDLNMKHPRIIICVFLLLLIPLSRYGAEDGNSTNQSHAPVLSKIHVRPNPVNPGAIIVFEITFVDEPGDLNGGTAVITDSRGNSYHGLVSDAKGTSGTLVTFILLDSLVTPGELLFDVSIVDLAGNLSNLVFAMITVL